MKLRTTLFSTLLLAALCLAACGGGTQNVQSNNSSTSTVNKETVAPSSTTATGTATPVMTEISETPIEFTYLGLTADKSQMRYKIKVLTARQISEVQLGVKYSEVHGHVFGDVTVSWPPIVLSAQSGQPQNKPIESGRTYEGKDPVPDGTAKADVVVKRVEFTDGSYWRPK